MQFQTAHAAPTLQRRSRSIAASSPVPVAQQRRSPKRTSLHTAFVRRTALNQFGKLIAKWSTRTISRKCTESKAWRKIHAKDAKVKNGENDR